MDVHTTKDEAELILKKWGEEGTLLRAEITTPDDSFVASTLGYLRSSDRDLGVGAAPDDVNQLNFLYFERAQIESYTFTDARHAEPFNEAEREELAKKHGPSLLSIFLCNGIRVKIFEVAEITN